jgi:hypothetical protein
MSIIATTTVAPTKTKIEIDDFVSGMMYMNHLQPRQKCTSQAQDGNVSKRPGAKKCISIHNG